VAKLLIAKYFFFVNKRNNFVQIILPIAFKGYTKEKKGSSPEEERYGWRSTLNFYIYSVP
jgi:hypothetical protein